MSVVTSARTVFGLSAGTPASYSHTDFGLLTFTNVAEITNFSEFGTQYNLVTHNSLSNRRTLKRKGSYNNGQLTLEMARVDDVGQDLIEQALASDNDYSCRILTQDNTLMYFRAQIMSYTANIQNVDSIFSASVQIEISEDIIEQAVSWFFSTGYIDAGGILTSDGVIPV